MPLFNHPYDNTKVTVELREIVESGVNIWDFDYPHFYTGDEKTAFEKKVIDHYYFRQIGQETVGRWLHYFRSRMREIMPYYIQLYDTVKIMEELPNPFDNVDVTETTIEERTGTTTGETETTATSNTENTGTSTGNDKTTAAHTEEHTRKFSNTPQGSISNLDSYLTEANVETADDSDTQTVESSANTSATSEGTASGSETHSGTQTERVELTYSKKGNQGVNTYAHDMLEYRQTLLNIDAQIINELKDLFLQVY